MFRKKHTLDNKRATIAFFNANGTDTINAALKLSTLLSSDGCSTLLVELPCQSIPRLAFQVDVTMIDKISCIDQLLIDYERKQFRSINDYITRVGNLNFIPIHPKNKPDTPVILKLSDQNTLIEMPTYIKDQTRNFFSYLLFPLQGQLIHPMTFFTLRCADVIVMVINDDSELPWSYATYMKLINDYTIAKERIIVLSERRYEQFKELEVVTKITDIIKKIPEQIGVRL
jgi:hypothetical protein